MERAELNGNNRKFKSPSKGEMGLVEMVREISRFVQDAPERPYRLIIGTDSKVNGTLGVGVIVYAEIVMVHRVGEGGIYFLTVEKERGALDCRMRVVNETLKSVMLAQEVGPYLDLVLPQDKYDLEIHIDVGPNGPTREVIPQVMGIVKGCGYKPKIKPYAYGASTVADKHT